MAPPVGTKYYSFKDPKFGTKIKVARAKSDTTLKSIKEKFGLSPAAVYAIESGTQKSVSKHGLAGFKKFCAKLGLPVPELVEGRPHAAKGEKKLPPTKTAAKPAAKKTAAKKDEKTAKPAKAAAKPAKKAAAKPAAKKAAPKKATPKKAAAKKKAAPVEDTEIEQIEAEEAEDTETTDTTEDTYEGAALAGADDDSDEDEDEDVEEEDYEDEDEDSDE